MILNYFALLGGAVTANCSDMSNDFNGAFFSRVIGCEEVTLDCLKSTGLITESEPMIFTFNGVSQGQNHEKESLSRIGSALGLPVLLTANLPGFKGVPGVDGVVFSKEGNPIANVGLKTFMGDTTKGILAAKSYLWTSRASVRDLYSAQYFAETFGFSVDERGVLTPKKGTPNQRVRNLLLRGTFKILGIGAQQVRPIWIALDFFNDANKSLNIRRGRTGPNPIPYDGTFIDFVDSREPPGTKSKVISVDSLAARSGRDPLVKRYLFLLNQSFVSVDSSGIEVNNEKYEGSSCSQALTAHTTASSE